MNDWGRGPNNGPDRNGRCGRNSGGGCGDMRPRCGIWCLIRTMILLTITFAAVFLWYSGLDKKAVMARLTGSGGKSKFKITTVEVETNQPAAKSTTEAKSEVAMPAAPGPAEVKPAEAKPPEIKSAETKPAETQSTSPETVAKPA